MFIINKNKNRAFFYYIYYYVLILDSERGIPMVLYNDSYFLGYRYTINRKPKSFRIKNFSIKNNVIYLDRLE